MPVPAGRKNRMADERAVRRPTKRALKALAAGLEQIKDHFSWEGFSDSIDEVTETEITVDQHVVEGDEKVDTEPEEESGNMDDPDEDPYYPTSFDREDVEIAVDEIISDLIRKRLIVKTKSGQLPSVSDAMATFFGEDHPITRVADRFEQNIKGYFGFIDYDDMKAAYNDILELQELISKELVVTGA